MSLYRGKGRSVPFNVEDFCPPHFNFHLVYSYFNLRCRIKALSLQDKTKGDYGISMDNYQPN